jgi:tRNA (adenine37-N6)-methyltransferase
LLCRDSMTDMDLNGPVRRIGIVRSGRTKPETTPIQASLNRDEHGIIDIDRDYRDGLDGLAGFDYAWLITWLHQLGSQAGLPPLRQIPYLLRLQRREIGLFATRSPRRINPIGLSLIQILSITDAAVQFAGVDLIDGTPVIDIKPYVTRFDRPPGEPRCGWYNQLLIGEAVTPEQLGTPGTNTPDTRQT